MTRPSLPTREAWGDLAVDSEVEHAFGLFGGKTVDEARSLFHESPIERAAELRFAPPQVFSYYILCFVELLTSDESRGESDMASCFLGLIRDRVIEDPRAVKPVWSELSKAVALVARRQAFYEAPEDIYGSFADLERSIREAYARHQLGAV